MPYITLAQPGALFSWLNVQPTDRVSPPFRRAAKRQRLTWLDLPSFETTNGGWASQGFSGC